MVQRLSKKRTEAIYQEAFRYLATYKDVIPRALLDLCWAREQKQNLVFKNFRLGKGVGHESYDLLVNSGPPTNTNLVLVFWDRQLVLHKIINLGTITKDTFISIGTVSVSKELYQIDKLPKLEQRLKEDCYNIFKEAGLLETPGEGKLVVDLKTTCVACPHFFECRGNFSFNGEP